MRCGTCDLRLFDVREVRNSIHLVDEERVVVERKCPMCHFLNVVAVTKQDGRPLPAAETMSGPWYCAGCGRCLGKIEATRGRLFVTCRRCKREVRVVAGTAIAVLHDESNRLPRR